MAKASCLDYVNLVLTRVVFAFHCCVSTWKCAEYYENNFVYMMLVGLIIMAVETAFAVIVRKAQGYRWVSPTILIYLCIIVPVIWFLELFMYDARIANRDKYQNGSGANGTMINVDGKISFTTGGDQVQTEMTRDWVIFIEQVLIFTLIIGRWMLPKGEMTRDEVTRLLMSYIGMSADIIGFFQAFMVYEIMYNYTLTILILMAWSVSLLQFAFVMTAAARKVNITTYTDDGEYHEPERENLGCGRLTEHYICDQEVVACLFVLLMQDLPFFILRMVMTLGYGAAHYMHTFFLGKNFLVIIIMCFKMFGAFIDRGKKKDYSEIEE